MHYRVDVFHCLNQDFQDFLISMIAFYQYYLGSITLNKI